MSFEYNEIDFDDLQSAELVEGDISPKTSHMDGSSGDLTKEQKRKKQLVRLLEDDFDTFHSLFDELIACYHSFESKNEHISDTLGVPDYVNCENCRHMEKSENGNPICLEADEVQDGNTVYKIIPDTESIPRFCPEEMRRVKFPKDQIDEVNDKLLSIAKDGYSDYYDEKEETYKERREQAIEEGREHSNYVTEDISDWIVSKAEYTAWELDKLVGGLFDPRDFDAFRQSALQVAWLLHLDDTLEEDYHTQRVEAYLRAMDSPHQSDALPGQGGDEFEKAVRDYLDSLGFPMLDRVFELEGVAANRKEMDIHTEFPWGERAIIEVFTRGAHSGKDKQLAQYTKLLKRAEGVDAVELMLTDGYVSGQTLHPELLINLLNTNLNAPTGIESPGNESDNHELDDVEYLGNADDLHYNEYEPEFEPIKHSKQAESKLIAKLRDIGYEPSLPVYHRRKNYAFCGPTVEIGRGEDRMSVTLFSNREQSWVQNEAGRERNERMFEKKEKGYGRKWVMDGPSGWTEKLASVKDIPVAVIEVSEATSKLHPSVFDRLLRTSL